MTKDYTQTLSTAKRLVKKFGRQITLRKLDPVTQTPAKPWLGAANPVTTGTNIQLFGVSVPLATQEFLGITALGEGFLKDVEQTYLVEPGETDPENIDTYNTLLDGDVEYQILYVYKLKPASLTVLYFIGVKR